MTQALKYGLGAEEIETAHGRAFKFVEGRCRVLKAQGQVVGFHRVRRLSFMRLGSVTELSSQNHRWDTAKINTPQDVVNRSVFSFTFWRMLPRPKSLSALALISLSSSTSRGRMVSNLAVGSAFACAGGSVQRRKDS